MPYRGKFLVEKVQLRKRFEDNKDIKDLRKAKVLLLEGEEELFHNLHPKPMKFPYSPGGICFERYYDHPDWLLDYWHPMEKARYPYYFARREQRKEEYIRKFEATYGVAAEEAVGVTHYQDYQTEPATLDEKMYPLDRNIRLAKTVEEFRARIEKEKKEKAGQIADKK